MQKNAIMLADYHASVNQTLNLLIEGKCNFVDGVSCECGQTLELVDRFEVQNRAWGQTDGKTKHMLEMNGK